MIGEEPTVVGQERSLDTAKHGVQYDTNWQEETRSRGRHSGELLKLVSDIVPDSRPTYRSYNSRATRQ
jgi:hypothetical protein